jgi:hypothetical protein
MTPLHQEGGILTDANSSWFESILYFIFLANMDAMEMLIEKAMMAITRPSTISLGSSHRGGTSGTGNLRGEEKGHRHHVALE